MQGTIIYPMNIRKPAAMCANISFLEALANEHVYTDYLLKASECFSSIEKL